MTMLKPVNLVIGEQMQQMLTGGQLVSSFQCCALCPDYMTFTQFHCYIPFVECGIFVGWHKVYYLLVFWLWLDGEYFYKGLQVLWLCFLNIFWERMLEMT